MNDADTRAGLIQQRIEAGADDHVFIVIERDEGPTISLDLSNPHGHGSLSVRADGMTIASVLTDVTVAPHVGDSQRLRRFCPYCGQERNLAASVDRHHCEPRESDRVS